MQSAMDTAVDHLLEATIGHGLHGGAPWPTAPLDDQHFEQLLRRGRQHGLVGALAEAAADGSLRLLPAHLEELAIDHENRQAHVLLVEQLLLRVSAAFRSRGIDCRVLKGVALAHLIYRNPSWRIAGDLDLLVPADQFDAAVALVVDDLEGRQALPELRPGFDREFGKESLVKIGRIEIDIHRTFVTGPFGLTIHLDELFESQTEISIGGEIVHGLGPEHQLLHACYNAALGDYPVRLASLRDLLLSFHSQQTDLDKVVATAARWRGTAVLQRAAQVVVDHAGSDVSGGLADLTRIKVSRHDDWLLRSYLSSSRSYSRPLASLAVIPGLRPRLRYARAILAPSKAYLGSRGWTPRTHVRRALRQLRIHG